MQLRASDPAGGANAGGGRRPPRRGSRLGARRRARGFAHSSRAAGRPPRQRLLDSKTGPGPRGGALGEPATLAGEQFAPGGAWAGVAASRRGGPTRWTAAQDAGGLRPVPVRQPSVRPDVRRAFGRPEGRPRLAGGGWAGNRGGGGGGGGGRAGGVVGEGRGAAATGLNPGKQNEKGWGQ